jgi:hypothetical protein
MTRTTPSNAETQKKTLAIFLQTDDKMASPITHIQHLATTANRGVSHLPSEPLNQMKFQL